MYERELQHYGVKGMRWGIRKAETRSGGRRRQMSEDARAVKELKKKKLSQMSNAELRKFNERVQLEQQYSKLKPGVVKKGMQVATTVAAATGTILTLQANGGKLIGIGRTVGNKVIDAAGDMILRDLAKHL